MLLIPEAWEKNKHHSKPVNTYFDYHSNYIEPWDGPAAMCFTDGKKLEPFLIGMVYVPLDTWLLMME